jgi:Leucine-rich repeat (LRR) protein
MSVSDSAVSLPAEFLAKLDGMNLEGDTKSTIAEYLGEEVARAHFNTMKAIKAKFKGEKRSNKISAAIQEMDARVLGHRLYHEAPNDVFELIVLIFSDMDQFGWGMGGLNVLRQVSKRCMQVVESVATRLTCKSDRNVSLPVAALNRCKRIEHIKSDGLTSLEGCPDGLKSLFVKDGGSLKSMEPLSACKELENLDFAYAPHISDLSPLVSCTRLKMLCLADSRITDLSPLASLSLLEMLDLSNDDGFEELHASDLSPLTHCKKLTTLDLSNNRGIRDLSPLSHCPDLRDLDLSDLTLIRDLSAFEKGFEKLRDLNIGGMEVDDLSPLAKLQNLEEISCSDIPMDTSLLPLANCPKLKRVDCSPNAMDVDELGDARPDMIIFEDHYDEDEDYDYEGEEEDDEDFDEEYDPYHDPYLVPYDEDPYYSD